MIGNFVVQQKPHPSSGFCPNYSSEPSTVTANGVFKAEKEILLTSRMTPRSLNDSSDREDRVASRSSKKQKFHPRSDSSLNFNSVLPVVAENGQNEVSKWKPWFCMFLTCFWSKKHDNAPLTKTCPSPPKTEIKNSLRLLNNLNWKYMKKNYK